MTSAPHPLDRRQLLQLAAAGSAAGYLGLRPGSAWADPAVDAAWPTARLSAGAAAQVDPTQFMKTRQLAEYGREVDRLGLRDTGGRKHEAYLRRLVPRFRQAGLQDVRLEPVPFRKWEATGWSVTIDGKVVPDTFYAPYTRRTGPSGVSAPMVWVSPGALTGEEPFPDVRGKVAVFEVPYAAIPLPFFKAISYPDAFVITPSDSRDPNGEYRRPWLNRVPTTLAQLTEAGAVATLGVWPDLPGHWARQYTPYDGVFRPIPSLWLDSVQGARIKEQAANGARAEVVLEATVRDAVTHNLVGFLPGRSRELTVLHTHTDGTNGMEENGQIGILAATQYLSRLPRTSLDRTVMVMLSTGHFAGGVGIRSFLETHEDGLVPRISSLLTLEHLGCTEWLPTPDGRIAPTGSPELGAYFSPSSKGLVESDVLARRRTGITGTVARPFLPAPTDFGPVEQTTGWPGEGTYFWWFGSLLNTNFITGPYGLIAADLPTQGQVDYALMRHKSMVAVEHVLRLASTSTADLRTPAE